jgi:phosphate starvation-inducible PhoH-like protein
LSRKKYSPRPERAINGDWETDQPRNGFSHQISVSARTPGQKNYIIQIKEHDITFCFGPAGTGKTAIAVGMGLQYITDPRSGISKMVIMRPAKEACDEQLGALPGDLTDKMSPWAAPVIDNMEVFVGKTTIRNLVWEKKVEVVPLAYARGRSFNHSFVILDEAQNCSPKQMLMALTRIGEDSKMIVNGDTTQSDNGVHGSGIEDAVSRLMDMAEVAVVRLAEEDIVRNPLIGEIVKRYGNGTTNGGH